MKQNLTFKIASLYQTNHTIMRPDWLENEKNKKMLNLTKTIIKVLIYFK